MGPAPARGTDPGLPQEQAQTARLKVIQRHRTKAGTIIDVAVEANSTTHRQPITPPLPKQSLSGGVVRKLPSARRKFAPNLAKSKTIDQVREAQRKREIEQRGTEETITNSYTPMVKQYLAEIKGKEKLVDEEEYEYDLYYFDDAADRSELEREYGVYVALHFTLTLFSKLKEP